MGTRPAPIAPQSGADANVAATNASSKSPPNPYTRSIPSNGSTHTDKISTTAETTTIGLTSKPESSRRAYATPPTSAQHVRSVTSDDESRVANPTAKPSRSRTVSNTGRLATNATRPDISAYTMIPTAPTTTAHRS